MPRVTQECDFSIHEDGSSVCSSAGGDVEIRGEREARESLGEGDDSYVEEGADDAATHGDGDQLDDKENSVAHSHGDYEQEEEGNSYLEEEVDADAGAHEDDSQLSYVEGSIVRHRVSDGWEDEEDSYLDQEDPETDLAAQENTDQRYTEGSIAYSHASDDSYAEHDQHDDALPTEAPDNPNADNHEPASKRNSATSGSHRRSSCRTDALIQAAAKAVVARIEKHRKTPDQAEATEDGEPDFSILSSTTDGNQAEQKEESHAETARAHGASPSNTPAQDDVGGDSSSHNGADADDDVFSDRSPRSSLGSAPSDPERKLAAEARSPRISNMSMYDEDEDFVPTCRATPRPPFRSPSYVRAMQMASPPASVYGSPRSSRRQYHSGVGSPKPQYSPKGRSTPTRFKAREAPLVLLHVTLLPLGWPWGDVLEGVEELSESAKGLRDAWRMLQSRMGDTVLERGVLLPHPQGDFEVLEERVLESLELPLRRRARILECGHYLGPSNEMSVEDSDSEEELGGRASGAKSTHWCGTCRYEIRYEALGEGRVFRVKVYASNGLMGAGAWGACWKEMERVDVEIEPWVDGEGQGELARLAAEVARREEEEEMYMEQEGYDTEYGVEEESHVQEQESMAVDRRHNIGSPAPSARPESQSRSLLSPAQRALASPSPGHRAQSTSVISRASAHVVRATPGSEMQLEERSSAAGRGHRHRRSRMLDSPAELDDDRALPGVQRRLLRGTPDDETQLERSHSAVSHHSASASRGAQRQGRARMQIEDRAAADAVETGVEDPFPTPDAQRDPPHPDTERRRRDEERLREIYGHTPPRSHESPSPSPRRREDSFVPEDGHDSYAPGTDGHEDSYAPYTAETGRHEDSFIPGPSPPSPSQQAFERREERRRMHQAASLPELLVEAARVFVGDGRNVVIFLLGVLVLGLAVRGGGRGDFGFADVVSHGVPRVEVSHESPPLERPGEQVGGAGARKGDVPPVQEQPESLHMTEREVGALTEEAVRIAETVTETVKAMSIESEVEVEVETETVFEVEVESPAPPSESAGSPEVEDETPVEDAQSELGVDIPEPGVETPEASVESELQSASSESADAPADDAEMPADELQSEPTADTREQQAGANDDEPSESLADTPAHEEL